MITQAVALSQVSIWFKFTRLWEVTNTNASRRAVVPISDAEYSPVQSVLSVVQSKPCGASSIAELPGWFQRRVDLGL